VFGFNHTGASQPQRIAGALYTIIHHHRANFVRKFAAWENDNLAGIIGADTMGPSSLLTTLQLKEARQNRISAGLFMAITIKTPQDIEKMRIAGRLAAEVLEIIEPHVKPGVSTGELDRICADHINNKQQAISACLDYHGFPKSVCISVNEVVCHGIPSDDKILKDGDIVNIDVTVIKEGFHGDTSKMFIAGKPTILGERLCRITQESLYLALKLVKPGIRLRTLGKEIQKFVEAENFSVVREYCGHGIGEGFHEEPQVLHYDADDGGVVLQAGMAFTIEPMVNAGDYRIRSMKDGWTVKTKDRSLSAQYEHTIVVIDNGCEIMTLRKDDTIPNIITHDQQ
jgi:methionyl aminopeptidase